MFGAFGRYFNMIVGSLQPSRGALEAACRWLRTTAMFRPKIPELLAAVREAGIIYEKALRALDELPGQIARAEHAWKQSEKRGGTRACIQLGRQRIHDDRRLYRARSPAT